MNPCSVVKFNDELASGKSLATFVDHAKPWFNMIHINHNPRIG